jgi:hypothetical protein
MGDWCFRRRWPDMPMTARWEARFVRRRAWLGAVAWGFGEALEDGIAAGPARLDHRGMQPVRGLDDAGVARPPGGAAGCGL